MHAKIDLPAARPEEVAMQMQSTFGIDPSRILQVSAKSGFGTNAVLDAIVQRVPPPAADASGTMTAFLFDSS